MATNTNQPSLAQLKRAVEISENIARLKSELASILGGISSSNGSAQANKAPKEPKAGKSGKRRGRPPGISKAIREFQEASSAPAEKPTGKKKRGMSEEGRKRIAEAQRKRWALKKADK